MNIIVHEKREKDFGEMRTAFCDGMIELATKNTDIFLLDADLMAAMGTKPFAVAFPERTIDCGIQEANMIGVAAGLSACGKIPFAHTFGVFASRRVFDQVFLSCAYAGLNVKIVGSDPGVTAAYNGGTHMSFEDMGLMRTIPNITIIEPTDIVMLKNLLPKIADSYGVTYMRLVRRDCEKVYDDGSDFTIGKAAQIRDGKDATIIAAGFCVSEALVAASLLAVEGISVRVLDMFTINPIDKDAIILAAKETGAIVTAENHNINNALGSAVAETICENFPVPLVRVGAKNTFGEVGSADYLKQRFEIDANSIVKAVKNVIEKKLYRRQA